MMWLVTSLALAATPPFQPGKAGKNCDKEPEKAKEAAYALEELIYKVEHNPVSSTSAEHKSRLKQVKGIQNGYICSRKVMLDTALVLLTSGNHKDLRQAHDYAREAAREGLDRSHFVATYALDRSLVARGMEQKFGTQFGAANGDPRGCMYPVDPTVSDDQRVAWSVPTLEILIGNYLEEKGHKGESPTEQTLRRLNLMCLSEKW